MRHIEIDDHLLQRLEEVAKKKGQQLSDLIALLLTRGLASLEEESPAPKRFVVKARPLHALPGVDFTSISRLLDSLDEERYP